MAKTWVPKIDKFAKAFAKAMRLLQHQSKGNRNHSRPR
jgi:hypothetical protein